MDVTLDSHSAPLGHTSEHTSEHTSDLYSANELKRMEADIRQKIKQYQRELDVVQQLLQAIPKCKVCRTRYVPLRKLTAAELEILEDSEQEKFDCDSCYQPLNERSMLCEKCIKIEMMDAMDAERVSMDAERVSMDAERVPMDAERVPMDAERVIRSV